MRLFLLPILLAATSGRNVASFELDNRMLIPREHQYLSPRSVIPARHNIHNLERRGACFGKLCKSKSFPPGQSVRGTGLGVPPITAASLGVPPPEPPRLRRVPSSPPPGISRSPPSNQIPAEWPSEQGPASIPRSSVTYPSRASSGTASDLSRTPRTPSIGAVSLDRLSQDTRRTSEIF